MALRREPAPSIGQLTTRMSLQSKAATPSGGNGGTGMVEAFTTVGKAWCYVEQIRGGRYVAGKQTEEVATHRVWMRYRDDYTLWRYLLAGTRRFRVLNIGDQADRHQWLVALCEELNT